MLICLHLLIQGLRMSLQLATRVEILKANRVVGRFVGGRIGTAEGQTYLFLIIINYKLEFEIK